MEIILDATKEIIIREIRKVTADKILLNQFVDTGSSVYATITPVCDDSLSEPTTHTLMLWDGVDYVKAGQYTDTDIINRIKELI